MKIKFTDLLLNAREFIDSIYNVFQFLVSQTILFSSFLCLFPYIYTNKFHFFFFSLHTELFFVNYSILESFLDPLNY